MASERYKSDEMVKSWVDGKRYYVMTVAVGDSAYLTAVYPTNFLGLVSRGKPFLAIKSPIDVPIDEIIQTHVMVVGIVESKPRSDWQAFLKIRGIVS